MHTSSKLAVSVLGILCSLGAPLAAPQVDVQSGAQATPSLSFAHHQPSVIRYVDVTNGNDNNSGEEGAPWKSIGKAVRTLQAGQAAVVRYGTYTENVQWSLQNANSGTFNTSTGTCTAPIILRGEPGLRPTVMPASDNAIFHVDRSCWIIEGFDFDMANRPAVVVKFASSGSHNNILRNSVIANSGGGAGVQVAESAHDISLIDNEIHSNFRSSSPNSTACSTHADCAASGLVCGVNGFCAQRRDSHAVLVSPDTSRILIRGNVMYDNSGDGVQCVGPVWSDPPTGTTRPSDITIEDNSIYNTSATHGASEGAVDIKDCDRVTVRRGRFHSFRPTNNTFGDKDDGIAIIAHFDAQGLRVEDTEIWDACHGIDLGNGNTNQVENLANVTIHHNIIRDGARGTGTSPRCAGHGIRLTRVQNVDAYNNTLVNLPGIAFAAGQEVASATSGVNVDFFNNILQDSGAGSEWLGVHSSNVTDFESSYNLFPSDTLGRFRCNFTSGMTLAGWRNCATGPNGLVTKDPAGQSQVGMAVFVYGDGYHLAAGSPGQDVALPITGARTCGSGQDMGAKESGCTALPAELGWRHQDGTSADESFQAVAVDGSGNTYAVGSSGGNLAGTPVSGTSDAIVRKYSPTGAVLWTRSLGRTGSDGASGVVVDPAGGVYVVGASQGSSWGYTPFIARYDASGNLRTDGTGNPWLKYLPATADSESFETVTLDSSGFVHAAGFKLMYGVLLPRVAKFDPNGTLIWDRTVNNIGTGSLNSIAMDAAGNIYAAFTSDQGPGDVVLKITPTATALSSQTLQYFDGRLRSLALDGAGNIVVGGYTSEALFTNLHRGGWWDAFVAKLDPQGKLLWSHQPGTPGDDMGNAVAVDAAGNIFLAGYTWGSMNAQPQGGRQDLFISKYSSAGAHLWTRQVGTFDGNEAAEGVASDGNGGAIVCGSTGMSLFATSAGAMDAVCARVTSP